MHYLIFFFQRFELTHQFFMSLLAANPALLSFVGCCLFDVLLFMAIILVVYFEVAEGLRKGIVSLSLLEKRGFSAHFQLACPRYLRLEMDFGRPWRLPIVATEVVVVIGVYLEDDCMVAVF